jgi:hypothetical protein
MTRHLRRLAAALIAARLLLLLHAGQPCAALDTLATAVGRRWRRLRAAREEGLATVEVAILAAVLLGLATALLAAITAVVNKHKAEIK